MANADPGPDLRALQGRWRQVAFEQNGVSDPPDTHGATNSLTIIQGNRFRVETVEGDLILKGTIEIDGSAAPKVITWTDEDGPKGQRSLECSYYIEGDRFVFIGAQDGSQRPTVFGRTRQGQTMRSFVREAVPQGADEGP